MSRLCLPFALRGRSVSGAYLRVAHVLRRQAAHRGALPLVSGNVRRAAEEHHARRCGAALGVDRLLLSHQTSIPSCLGRDSI